MTHKSYKELQDEIYQEALTEAFLELGEDHEFDAMASAQEAVYEWSNEFPENGNDWQDQS